MYIPKIEQETIITFNEAEKTASVYTMNSALKKKLEGLTQPRPDDARLVKTFPDGAQEYEVPKKWVKIIANRILTQEETERRLSHFQAANSGQLDTNLGRGFQTLTPLSRQITRREGKTLQRRADSRRFNQNGGKKHETLLQSSREIRTVRNVAK